jgi:hypothetical protein
MAGRGGQNGHALDDSLANPGWVRAQPHTSSRRRGPDFTLPLSYGYGGERKGGGKEQGKKRCTTFGL